MKQEEIRTINERTRPRKSWLVVNFFFWWWWWPGDWQKDFGTNRESRRLAVPVCWRRRNSSSSLFSEIGKDLWMATIPQFVELYSCVCVQGERVATSSYQPRKSLLLRFCCWFFSGSERWGISGAGGFKWAPWALWPKLYFIYYFFLRGCLCSQIWCCFNVNSCPFVKAAD